MVTITLAAILQLIQAGPQVIQAAQAVRALLTHPSVTVTDSAGVPLSVAAIADLNSAAAAATASAVTGVQAAG